MTGEDVARRIAGESSPPDTKVSEADIVLIVAIVLEVLYWLKLYFKGEQPEKLSFKDKLFVLMQVRKATKNKMKLHYIYKAISSNLISMTADEWRALP